MSTALASIQKQIQQEIMKQKENNPISGGKINTKGKVFTLPDGEVIKDKITAIILDYRYTNVYFTESWDGQSKTRPTCSASGLKQDSLTPAKDLETKIADSCDACPMGEWGSAANGRGGKACSNKVRLAIVTADAGADAPIYTIDLTPTALKSFSDFMDTANKQGLLACNLVTEITFVESATYPTLRLKVIGENKNLETHWVLRERAQKLI